MDTVIVSNGACYIRYCDKPILKATQEFFGKEQKNVVKIRFESQDWFVGSGLPPAQHPGKNELRVLGEHLPLTVCGKCRSKNVRVIALQGCVAGHSGDAYYDYEIICKECNHFTAFSYAEN